MFMIYRSEEAVTPLRETWEQADELLREAIVSASSRVNQRLSRNPHEKGESRDGRTRILFQSPICVLFEVNRTKKVVNIVRSWAYCKALDTDGRCS